MQKGAVLCIDDDADLQTVLGVYLNKDGYKVVAADTAAAALEKATALSFDIILLDLVLPDGEGMTLIPQLKSKNQGGVIVVSGKSDTTEKIVCLEMGADDYMTKPFEMRELSARITAVLRRLNGKPKIEESTSLSKAEKIFFNGWCLDRTQYQLLDDKKKSAGLTTGEFKLLEALIVSAPRVLSREHLFDLTRDQQYDSFDRAIDTQIARLRKKLGKNSKLVITVRGIGYMFSGDAQSA